jgi:hypothetical protein
MADSQFHAKVARALRALAKRACEGKKEHYILEQMTEPIPELLRLVIYRETMLNTTPVIVSLHESDESIFLRLRYLSSSGTTWASLHVRVRSYDYEARIAEIESVFTTALNIS